MTEWTQDVDAVLDAYRRTVGETIPSVWWLAAERYDDGVLVLSCRQNGALLAEPVGVDGAWRARWWYLPDGRSGPEGNVDDEIDVRSQGDVEWFRLRAYTAMVDRPEGVGVVVFDSSWVEHRSRWTPAVTAPGDQVFEVMTAIMFDQHLRQWLPRLYDAIPDLCITYAGGHVPMQAYGVWNGRSFYFRYRGGKASLAVSRTDPMTEAEWLAFGRYGEETDGFLDWDEFEYVFTALAAELEVGLSWYLFRADTPDGARGVMAFNEEDARLQLGPQDRDAELVSGPVGERDTRPTVKNVVPPPNEKVLNP